MFLLDIAADAIGGLIAGVILLLFQRKHEKTA